MTQARPLVAFAWMMGAVVSFSLMAVAARAIQTEMNTFELMLYRSGIGFVTVCGILALGPTGFYEVRTRHGWLHVKRNLLHYIGQNLWFTAVMLIPLSQLVALEFTNPIWVTLLAPFFLGEKLTRMRVIAALIGFVGVLIVAQPGRAPIHIGHVAAAGAAICFAMNTIYTKQIMRTDSVLCVLFWMTLAQGSMSFLLSLPGGIPVPSLHLWPWMLVIGLTGLSAHYSLTSALRFAPATIVAPMEFIRLPVVAVIGALLYAEPLRPAVFIGAAIIICANLMNMRAATRPLGA